MSEAAVRLDDLVAVVGEVWGAEVRGRGAHTMRGTPRPDEESGVHIVPRSLVAGMSLIASLLFDVEM